MKLRSVLAAALLAGVIFFATAAPVVALIPAAGGGWSWLNPSPQGGQLPALDIVDQTHAWSGGDGCILFSADSGATWTSQAALTDCVIKSISFCDAQHGWAMGWSELDWSKVRLFATDDGGGTWAEVQCPGAYSSQDVVLLDGGVGMMVGYGGTIWRTTDAGASWARIDVGSNIDLAAIDMASASEGWAVGSFQYTGAGAILHTTDGGVTWTPQNPGGSLAALRCVWAVDEDVVWVGGNCVGRTSDGGATWTALPNPELPGTSAIGLAFADADHGWVAMANQGTGSGLMNDYVEAYVGATTDGGQHWSSSGPWSVAAAGTVDCLSQQQAWFTGSDLHQARPAVTSTGDGGATWVTSGSGVGSASLEKLAVAGDHLWAAGWCNDGDQATVDADLLHSADGGGSWTSLKVSESGYVALHSVFFLDEQHGWVGGENGQPFLARTTDGGATWQPADLGLPYSGIDVRDIAFVSADVGWLVAYNYQHAYIYHTVDGSYWIPQSVPQEVEYKGLTSIEFADPTNGWVIGDGVVLRTTNAGALWQTVTVAAAKGILRAQSWPDAQHGWMVGKGSTIVRTQDGGVSWKAQAVFPNDMDLKVVAFADALNGWASDGYRLIHTSDGGVTWRLQGTEIWGSDIAASSATDAFVCGSSFVWKTQTGGVNAQDSTSPVITLTKPSGTWHNHDVKVVVKTTDPSGLWAILFALDKGNTDTLNPSTPYVLVGPSLGQGLHNVTAAAVDGAGNGSAPKSVQVGIDTKKPTKTWPFNRPTTYRGAYTTFKYQIYDPMPGCGKAKATLLIATRTRIVKKISLGTVTENKKLSFRWRCALPRGAYWWAVDATDIAGNRVAAKNVWFWTYAVK